MSATFGRPGSLGWLVRHEMRLAWRGVGGRQARRSLGVLVVLSVLLHGGAWMLLRQWPDGEWPPALAWLLGVTAWYCISLMLSQAIGASVSALFDRGDLDLLLSSPLPARTVFVARGLGIALNVAIVYLFLLGPVGDMGVFAGRASLLAVYPTLLALALAVTSVGLALTLGLVRWLGARRARSVAQVTGTLVGASIFLASQATGLLGPQASRALFTRVVQWSRPGGPLALDSPLWWPARALRGELAPMAAIALVGGVLFWAVTALAHRRFLAGTQASVTGSARRGGAAPRAGSARFRSGLWRVVLAKEWRLIARDTQLITQTLMQVMYLLPLMFMLLRAPSGVALAMLAAAAVYLASSLVANIAWITVAAEEAPELLGSAPQALPPLRALKVLAALVPAWLLVSPLTAFLAWRQPLEALVFVGCLAGGTLSLGAAQVWYPRQGKRSDLRKRMKGNLVLALLELLLALSWAGLAYCLGAAPAWTPLPLALAVAGCASIWLLGRSKRDREAPIAA